MIGIINPCTIPIIEAKTPLWNTLYQVPYPLKRRGVELGDFASMQHYMHYPNDLTYKTAPVMIPPLRARRRKFLLHKSCLKASLKFDLSSLAEGEGGVGGPGGK